MKQCTLFCTLFEKRVIILLVIYVDYTKLNEYLLNKKTDDYEKSYAWKTAIGLQKVDNLEPSEYLYETARKSIENEISFQEAKELIHSYYESKPCKDRTEEADKVTVRIAEILTEKSFNFSSVEYMSIHLRLFKGIYKHAGKFRDYNISKEEWVLNGESVIYGDFTNLKETLEYDLRGEKEFSYKGISIDEMISHLARFVSNLWQNHIFGEGNTRTTAVFLIKYLNTLGFEITNDMFLENSWYFRNALVRANYTNIKKNIYETTYYLELFLRDLLLNEDNKLSNRAMHVDYENNIASNKSIINTDDLILEVFKQNPSITLDVVALKANKSLRTIKTIVKRLIEENKLVREGSKKTGKWIVKQ